jgi:hypothetical protein
MSTFDALKVVGDLALTATQMTLRIRNGLTLEGTAVLDNFAGLEFRGTQAWTSGSLLYGSNIGGGVLQFNDQLTLGPAILIHGRSGNIRELAPTARLINQGTIAVDVNAGRLIITASQFTNEGTIQAEAANSIITINSANFMNTGVTQELNGGKVLINP